MLRRNSSRNKQRRPLGRSQSACSIFRHPTISPVSIHPFVAERDAHIAAALSFHRAQTLCRLSSDMLPQTSGDNSFNLARRSSVMSGIGLGRGSVTEDQAEPPSVKPVLQKRKSVRFTGPNARPRRALAVRANQPKPSDASTKIDATDFMTKAYSLANSSDSEGRPHVADAALVLTSGERQLYEAPRCSARDNRLAPPSLGSLRKSTSMLASTPTPSLAHEPHDDHARKQKLWIAPLNHKFDGKENVGARACQPRGLRALKSMSFIHSHEGSCSPPSSQAQNDFSISGIALPNSSPYLGRPRRRLGSHSSIFFRPRPNRYEKSVGLPKSLRNSSNNSGTLSSAFSGNTLIVPKQRGLRSTARKVSRTLKSKFKIFFSRSRSACYGTPEMLPDSSSQDSGRDILHGDVGKSELEEASIFRVPSHMPSLHAVPLNRQMRSRQGSLESIIVEPALVADERSRVTSWTNSTANTVLTQCSNADWERQRLSVIKESGLHVPPTLSSCPRNSHLEMNTSEASKFDASAIDSRRVYSALLKRLNKSRQQEDGLQMAESPETLGRSSSRCSSAKTARSISQTPRAICSVPTDDVFRNQKKAQSPIPPSEGHPKSLRQNASVPDTSRTAFYKAYPDPAPGDGRGLSPPKADLGTDRELPRSLAHERSAFFASPPNHFFRTTSPYRRALRETIKEVHGNKHTHALDTRYLSTLSALSLPSRRPSTAGSDGGLQMTYAESVYSSDSVDGVGNPTRQGISAVVDSPSLQPVENYVDVTIQADAPEYNTDVAHSRQFSSASSIEWKRWLSANVSKLESPSADLNTIGFQRSESMKLLNYGHIREGAEIESPGDGLRFANSEMISLESSQPQGSFTQKPGQTVGHTELKTATENGHKPGPGGDENDAPGAEERAERTRAGESALETPERSNGASQASPLVKARAKGVRADIAVLPQMRSLNSVGKAGPQTRQEQLLRCRSRTRRGARSSPSAKSSPGLTAAVKRQFGKMPFDLMDDQASHGDNESATEYALESASSKEGSDLVSADWEAQVMGSKRMVDLFLSSRRRRIEGTKSGTESDGASAAFS